MIHLVDACVVIDALRGRAEAVTALERASALAGSEITRYEVLAGVEAGEETATEQLLGAVAWLAVDEIVSRRAALLYRRYRPAYSGIDDADYLVAATALEYELELMTVNVRHFPMLEDLQTAY